MYLMLIYQWMKEMTDKIQDYWHHNHEHYVTEVLLIVEIHQEIITKKIDNINKINGIYNKNFENFGMKS